MGKPLKKKKIETEISLHNLYGSYQCLRGITWKLNTCFFEFPCTEKLLQWYFSDNDDQLASVEIP